MSLCEKDCNYTNYDFNTKRVLCECLIKMKLPLISEIEINIDKLLSNFKDIKHTMNLNVIKCYKEVFNKEGLIYNLGNYIMSTIIIITLILSILFKIKGYNNLKNKINEIIKNNSKINGKKKKNNPPKKNSKNKRKTKNKINTMVTNYEKESKLDKNSRIRILQDKNRNNYLNKKMILNNKIKPKNKINYNDYELNSLSYEIALKLDKRSYFQYYLSLLKTKHLIIFTFFNNTDYNSKIIKIIIFLFSFALHFTINTLFFNNNILHKIYEDQGKYNFIYQMPNILYSTLITSFISILIKYLSLTETNVIEIKNEKKNVIEKSSKILEYLIIKLILFFILIFIFLFSF